MFWAITFLKTEQIYIQILVAIFFFHSETVFFWFAYGFYNPVNIIEVKLVSEPTHNAPKQA